MNKRYKVIKSLGKGGMGEVFLALDREAERHVAIKKIREDLKDKPLIKKRFIREAKIASKLSHPSILPIYDLCLKEPLYYTMPYVEGKTLKEILNETKNDPFHLVGSSIASLIRFFLNVCEAISYMHAKGIIHRDIKPDNIIIGKYGEVLILDLGIAKFIKDKETDIEIKSRRKSDITKPGKTAGTLAFMAPERAMGKKADISTDIYSLGGLLYQMLTLETPSRRANIEVFRKIAKKEKIISPIERAPQRGISKKLADISLKCLSFEKTKRYKKVDDLIKDIKDYIDGKPEWILNANLNPYEKSDWQFQENILLSKNIAISKNADIFEWITLMVTKLSFSSNIRIEADIALGKNSNGIGFLLNILKSQNSYKFEDGYRLWINLKKNFSKLYRSNVLVFNKRLTIKPDIYHKIVIEKVDDVLKVYIDGDEILTHSSHLPLRGNYFGFAFKDTNFLIKNLNVYSSSYNVMVNCLAIADTFFAKEDFNSAIKEYQKISFSFPGRFEEREAFFRCGIAYLEKAKMKKIRKNKDILFNKSLDEFEKLHLTASKPLEYLGKSLVYKEKEDFEEEAKCLELMIRKNLSHPLIKTLYEHIIYRMHQSSLESQEAAYRIILIAIRFIPKLIDNIDTKKLIDSLQQNIEKLYFIEENDNIINLLSIKLSYILNKPSTLIEILENSDLINTENALFSLLELNQIDLFKNELEKCKNEFDEKSYFLLEIALKANLNLEDSLIQILNIIDKKTSQKEIRVLIYILEKLIFEKQSKKVLFAFEKIKKLTIKKEFKIYLDSLLTKAYMLEGKLHLADDILKKYPLEKLDSENNPLHFIYGIWLYKTEGKEISKVFFSKANDLTHPKSYAISSHYISSKRKDFIKQAFFFEKKRLVLDLVFYSDILKDSKKLKLSKNIF